ncbi:MAG: DUF4350 domain-containing protein [Cytophagales bacterium]|nr:DUF4350 domain-containing protein [Armatimonadota bacterium]
MSLSPPPEPRRRFPKPGGDTLILVALLLLFAALSFGIARQSEPPADPIGTEYRSSYSVQPGGWKAFYRLLETRGVPVTRWQRRPKEWPAGVGVVVTGPYSVGGAAGQWSEQEVGDALGWVSGGGVLLVFTDASDDLSDTLGLRMSEDTPLNFFRGDDKDNKRKKAAESKKAAQAVRTLQASPLPPDPAAAALSVRQPALFFEGVSRLDAPGEKRFTSAPQESVILIADRLPLSVAIPYGKGLVVAVADAGIPDNIHLANEDNARFVTQIIESYASGRRSRVLFDEYHQGYREANTFWTAIGRPGQLAFWQITALFLLMAYSASRRFGLPLPLAAPPRVSSEYVASLADLYRRAQATDAALSSVHRIFWRDLCRAAGMPLDAPISEVVLQAVAQVPALGEAERAALAERTVRIVAECRARVEASEAPLEPEKETEPPSGAKSRRRIKKAKPKPGLGETELLRLVTAIEGLRKELELGGSDHAGAFRA